MCGRATLTMGASSTTISCAAARTGRARPRRAPPAAAPPGGAPRGGSGGGGEGGPGGVDVVGLGRRRCVAEAPVQQVVECGLQRPPGVGQLVHGHVGRCRERAPGDDTGGLQVLQASGQDVAGDARQAGGKVAVTARAESQLPHEQQAPPFAADVQGPGAGACLPVTLHESQRTLCFYKCLLHDPPSLRWAVWPMRSALRLARRSTACSTRAPWLPPRPSTGRTVVLDNETSTVTVT